MSSGTGRRGFLKQVALAGAAVTGSAGAAEQGAATTPQATPVSSIQYPRVFRGRQLSMLAFPLGGVGAGALALGGRGQLCDWEIFNRSEKGRSPTYAFPYIWAQAGAQKPVGRVLESRILPPYGGNSGLGADNAPGLARLSGASFTGEYPLAHIDFQDSKLPVKVSLEAFSPFVPHDADDSGLPVAMLRYRVRNPGKQPAKVSIAFSIDNPVSAEAGVGRREAESGRSNTHRKSATLEGLVMQNTQLASTAPRAGSFVLAVRNAGKGSVTFLTGWPRASWWSSPLLFLDDLCADGQLGPESGALNSVGSLCLQREIAPGAEADFEFLLAWHFPNRTPARMSWPAATGQGDTLVGNYYCKRFADAWEAAEYAAGKLPELEKRMRQFLTVMRETTLPAAVKEAAMANASTLAATTCFRTADGRFFGFEGAGDRAGCCYGNCAHVWSYECTTHHLFPTLARSMRETHLELVNRETGAMANRTNLPLHQKNDGAAAADGQMGQIIKTYLDWQLSGDDDWLRKWWPSLKKAIEFAWIPGGWDADRDGVPEGVQLNTYDVEFYGPNPMVGIYYLGALRAGEEMARGAGDLASAEQYHALYQRGRDWIDRNLFNGEYYIQQIRGIPQDKIAAGLIEGSGSKDTEHPELQMGDGCLVDQLIGQHVGQYAGLGPLVDPAHIRTALQSIYKYNYKRSLADYDCVQRTYALNDEAGLVICDYGKGTRPRAPFPYYAEVWTGIEYPAAALMIAYGMVKEGIECFENTRRRYDGERRNAWDEAECGRHYARAMSAWAAIPALSGFRYGGPAKHVQVAPRISPQDFRSFWSTGTGWGVFTQRIANGQTRASISVLFGRLPVRTVELASAAASQGKTSVLLRGRSLAHQVSRTGRNTSLSLSEPLNLSEGDELIVEL